MKTNRRRAGWFRKAALLLGLAGGLLIPQAATLAQGEYEYYYNDINSKLGPSYAQEYFNLTKGNYRYGSQLACYCVYAFANGFNAGYQYGRQANAAAEAAYNQNLALVRSWVGLTSGAGRHEVEIALYAGWCVGSGRARRGEESRAPTNADFRAQWSPGKSAGPIPSDAGPYDELRDTR
jgi:hypothetical protein